jgi:ATP-binding cassette, subfamily B, multidrug efflux pump
MNTSARSLKLVRLMGMLWPTLELMLGFAVVLVLWLGGREVLQGQDRVQLVSYLNQTTLMLNGSMGVGDFAAFTTYMVQLTWPVIALGWVINIFQRGTASIRINEILLEQPEIKTVPTRGSGQSRAKSNSADSTSVTTAKRFCAI